MSFVPLFEGLGEDVLARIACRTRQIRPGKGDILFRKDDPCGGFHVVIYGQVKLFFTSAQGEESVVDLLGQERTFGEALMLAEQPYMVSAQVLADSFLLFIPKAAVLDELDTSPRLRLHLLKLMSGHLQQLIADGGAYSLQSGTQRLIGYLLRQLQPGPGLEGGDAVVILSTSKANLSSLLNITQEHFSRILRTLSEEGLISVCRNRILIPDVARLRDCLGPAPALPPPDPQAGCRSCGAPLGAKCRLSPDPERPCARRPAGGKAGPLGNLS